MNCLIDTNILLWFAEKNPQLPNEFLQLLLDESINIYVSMASLWEISIKYSFEKLKLPASLESFIDDLQYQYNFIILPITEKHLIKQASLPFHHRDPFDRLIYAQSVVENLDFLYTDIVFDLYKS